jgi:hypothetical protein
MLKIWLNCLQPSVGILGVVFILANAVAANAAPKSQGVNNTNKNTKQQTVAKTAGTTIDRELAATAIPETPDAAIRQLALDALSITGSKPPSVAAKSSSTAKVATSDDNNNGLANFVAPSVAFPTVAPKTVARAVPKKAPQQVATAVVPGLFIGTTEVQVASQFLPNAQSQFSSQFQPVASGTQTKLPVVAAPMKSSPVVAAVPAADPFPVVNPARMAALQQQPTVTPNNTAVASLLPGLVDSNPLSSIPQGLQRILGNEPSTGLASSTPTIAKIGPTQNSELSALSRIVDGGASSTLTAGRGATLKLDTAQAYASLPQLNLDNRLLPTNLGTIRTTKPVKAESVFTTRQVTNNVSVAIKERKKDYVALVSDRQISQRSSIDMVRPTWEISYRSENTQLGGLILGQSSSVSLMSKQPSMLSQNTIASSLPLGSYRGF